MKIKVNKEELLNDYFGTELTLVEVADKHGFTNEGSLRSWIKENNISRKIFDCEVCGHGVIVSSRQEFNRYYYTKKCDKHTHFDICPRCKKNWINTEILRICDECAKDQIRIIKIDETYWRNNQKELWAKLKPKITPLHVDLLTAFDKHKYLEMEDYFKEAGIKLKKDKWKTLDELEKWGMIYHLRDGSIEVLNKEYLRPSNASSQKLTKDEIKLVRNGINDALRYKVMNRDRFHCVICGCTGKEGQLVVDHIIPVSRGGQNNMENLRTLCTRCNSGKGAMLEE
ncbi:MAG: HNH endonuclease [Chloroflexota bacterium]